MSAFMVDKLHIDILVRFAVAHGVTFECRGKTIRCDESCALALGKLLVQANAASLAHRYPYPDEIAANNALVDAYTVDDAAPLLDRPAIRIASACYAYQACERDDWTTSPAKAFCDALDAESGWTYEAAQTMKRHAWEVTPATLERFL